jgi:outer membrane protein OmpA-like peptidoglycan-associated protein
VAATFAAGCSTTPQRNAALDDAQSAVNAARNDSTVTRVAGAELRSAEEALARATALWREDDDRAAVDHYAYLARERALLAQDIARVRTSDEAAQAAGQERERIRLQARTREAETAQARAQAAQSQAQAAQTQSAAAIAAAQAARQQAEQQAAENQRLQQQLQELSAQKTSRGTVVTLGDVLFDVGGAELRPGALRQIDRLAALLKENPDRSVVIEGFTDSTGGEDLNYRLSQRRAEAVRNALLDRGVPNDRIETRPYGEAYPVAPNTTAAGRQQNRRVEVVISEAGQRVQAR